MKRLLLLTTICISFVSFGQGPELLPTWETDVKTDVTDIDGNNYATVITVIIWLVRFIFSLMVIIPIINIFIRKDSPFKEEFIGQETVLGSDINHFGSLLSLILMLEVIVFSFFLYAAYIYKEIYNTLPPKELDFYKFIIGEHFIGGPFNVLCLFLLVVISLTLYSILIHIRHISKLNDTESKFNFWLKYYLVFLPIVIFVWNN